MMGNFLSITLGNFYYGELVEFLDAVLALFNAISNSYVWGSIMPCSGLKRVVLQTNV